MRLTLLGVLAAGIVLLLYVWPMPTYTDAAKKEQLDLGVSAGAWSPGVRQEYFQSVRELRTNRNALMNMGLSLVSLSATLLVGAFLLKLRRWADLADIESPRQASRIYALGSLFWLALIPAAAVIYKFRFDRGDYPWFADAILIPIMGQTILVIIGFPLLLLFLRVYAPRGAYPARLFESFPEMSSSDLGNEVVFFILGAANLYILATMFVTGDFAGLPSALVLLYLLLSARAGLINRQILSFETPATGVAK